MKSFLILFFFSAAFLNAQEWVSIYGNGQENFGYNIVLDQQNNSYIVGSSDNKILILKYNTSGIYQWAEVYIHSSPVLFSFANEIKYDNSGNLYVGGGIQKSDSTNAILILKYNTSGNLIWAKTFDRTSEQNDFISLALDETGNPYVLGYYGDPVTFSAGSEVIRYNPQGDTIWTCKYPNASASSIKADEFGNSYVTGTIFTSFNLLDCITYKIDPNGNLMWDEIHGSSSLDIGYSLCINQTGDIYVTGFDGKLEDAFIVKYDPDGGLVWSRTYNSPENYPDRPFFINLDNSENVYVSGQTNINDTLGRILILKYDGSGNRIWETNYSGADNRTFISDMFITGNGRVTISANSTNEFYFSNLVTFILNTDGILEWQAQYVSSNIEDYSTSLAVDDNNNIYITGYSLNDSGSYDGLTLKYNDPVNILQLSSEVPGTFSLEQNYPNPFNPVTKINFNVRNSGKVKLTVFDIMGKEVGVIVNEFLSTGTYETSFDGTNFTSGIYFYRLEAGNFSETKKMNLIK